MRKSPLRQLTLRIITIALVALLFAASPASAKKSEGCNKCDGANTDQVEATTTTAASAPDQADEVAPTAAASESAPSEELVTYRSGTADAADRPGSLYSVVDEIGARELWQQGITGEGVDIAVIDTGVAPVPALTGAHKVGAMVDLSLEAHVPEATYLDTYGHGSHMAGIIAGSDPGGDPATADQRPDEFHGVAPGARIISVKVGDNTGAVDVSQVIAGIDWVIEHRDVGDMNIRVINLSYGTDSDQPYEIDPLAYAVERAWDAGIVVVAAAGNEGWKNPGLANPANDPFVVSVGASATHEWGFSYVPEWASGGVMATQDDEGNWNGFWDEEYAGRYPDLVAPGQSIESLRVPGSRIATEHPEGYVNETILKGSGTSQSAAVVSGAAALLLEQRPRLKPDQVKSLLMDGAEDIVALRTQQGAGRIDISKSASLPTPSRRDVKQRFTRSDGSGSLEASRGSTHVTVDGTLIEGEQTVWGLPWDGSSWTGSSWTGSSWTGSSWTGSSWTGSSWTGSSWTGSSWTGSSWTGSSWTGSSWTGSSWTGSSWTGSSWTGSSWTGSSWTGSSWTGSSWTGSSWTGSSWTENGWMGVSW